LILNIDSTCYELCKSLLSAEARAFIDDHDQDTPLVATFPSSIITIADLMTLQSKFGIPSTTDIIAQALKIKVDSRFKQSIRLKITFVKKGMMRHFKKYTNESCKEFLIKPYRTTDGMLKNLLKRVPRETKIKHIAVENGTFIFFSKYVLMAVTLRCIVFIAGGGGELSSAPPFQLGDKVEVIADTSPGVHSQHSCGIDRAEIVEIGEQCSKVRKIGPLDRNCLTTVPNQLLSPLSKTGLQEVLSRTELREEKKKRVLVDVVTSDVVEDNKKVIGEKDVAINKYLDLFNQERKINEELRAQVNTVVEEKNNLKSKFLSEKREYQKELQLEYETQQQKTELKCKKKLEELEAVAARELADVERHYSISLQTLEARTQLQEYEYKASFQALLSKQNQQHEEALLAKTIAERSATAKRKEIEEVVKKLTLAQAALSRGDPNDPSLTKEGKALAAALEEVSQRHRVRAERQAEFHKKEAARFQKETENALLLCNLKDEYLKATKAEVKALKQKLKRRDKSLADLKDGTTFSKQSPDKLPQFLREFKEISAVS
jgi:hypothetical protein